MGTHERPATPEEDIARYREGKTTLRGVLTTDLIELAQAGASIILGCRSSDGYPVAGNGLACRVDQAGKIRVLFGRAGNEPLLSALEAGSGIAVTFGRVRDHRGFQVKARSAAIRPAGPDDTPEIARQLAVFCGELVDIGYAPPIAEGLTAWEPDDVLAMEFFPVSAYVQTPGPGAGSPLSL
ncbi:hypothetical protein [Oricola cellulosilytica]|uniref:Pyridoxamine 5'-phosphate oxidase family protein n=1 Tax=Oricola cellulosilytica TaxID=1429082 RepID=A0A4R0PEB1_9HYPH|nr:hypothetical protein [Oricola cellulosilytica]TCD16135.1 hypothetical protein E0D97_01470 [Oricola cellulosilytica]